MTTNDAIRSTRRGDGTKTGGGALLRNAVLLALSLAVSAQSRP